MNVLLFSAFFVTLLDVVIDPVAHMGARWFLGEIYYYPEPGYYFDITMANFLGWFIVSLIINYVGIYILDFYHYERLKWPSPDFTTICAIGLYYGIFAFGLFVAIYLEEWLLVFCDLFWIGLASFVCFRKAKTRRAVMV